MIGEERVFAPTSYIGLNYVLALPMSQCKIVLSRLVTEINSKSTMSRFKT